MSMLIRCFTAGGLDRLAHLLPTRPSVWVLAGRTHSDVTHHVMSHHTSASLTNDDILHRFWEIEESPSNENSSIEDQSVVNHFKGSYRQCKEGRFTVPLSRCSGVNPLSDPRSQAVMWFMMLECSLLKKNQHIKLDAVMREYLDLGHAEAVPIKDLKKPQTEVFYLPVHAVYKSSSTTTKVRAVFDASIQSSTGVSLNDQLLVGPTEHSPLVNVLLHFRLHQIAITTDICKMYRAVDQNCDLHQFVWRSNPSDVIKDYQMTRVTFGVSASFLANMCMKQKALILSHEYPLAPMFVQKSFYVDDGLTEADDTQSAIQLQRKLDKLFARGAF